MAIFILNMVAFNSDLSCLSARNLNGLTVKADGILLITLSIRPMNHLFITIQHSSPCPELGRAFITRSEKQDELCFENILVGYSFRKIDQNLFVGIVAETIEIYWFLEINPSP